MIVHDIHINWKIVHTNILTPTELDKFIYFVVDLRYILQPQECVALLKISSRAGQRADINYGQNVS